MSRPNILFVVFDTARADALEPYGAPSGASTSVAQLAARGTALRRAFSTGCWTVPAHGSLFSGELPRSMGLEHIGGQTGAGFRQAMHAFRDRLLPTWLSSVGYETAGISTNLWVSPQSGFDTGFDRFTYIPSPRNQHLTPRGRRDRASWLFEAFRARVDDGASAVESELQRWVESAPRQPFFWFVNLVECHSPYLPPKPFNGLHGIDRLRAATEASRHLTLDEIWKCCVGGFDVPPDALDRMRRLYAGAIRQMDAWLARVLSALDHHGLLDETQIVLTSDHGENFGENGLMCHAFSLDDRLIRIPFVTAGPMGAPDADRVFSLTDVPRWIAGAAADEHPWVQSPTSRSVAVAQLDAPGEGNLDRALTAVREWGLGDDAVARLCGSFVAATDGRHKLVRHRDGREVLYDLDADALEERPAPVDAATATQLGELLRELRRALDDATEREVPKSIEYDAVVTSRSENDELEAQMRLLGYL